MISPASPKKMTRRHLQVEGRSGRFHLYAVSAKAPHRPRWKCSTICRIARLSRQLYCVRPLHPGPIMCPIASWCWSAIRHGMLKAIRCAQPMSTKIDITFGLQADAAIQQLQAGDADVVWDIIIPPAILQMLTMTGDEKLSTMGLAVRPSSSSIRYPAIMMEPSRTSRSVRLSTIAVDRAAIVQQMGGPAVAAPQHGIFGPGCVGLS